MTRADQYRLDLVGWVRWDGDEYHDFRYAAPGDHKNPPQGYLAVYAWNVA